MKKTQLKNLAKFFWDLSKITYATLVLTPLLKIELYNEILLLSGSALVFLLALVGYILDGMGKIMNELVTTYLFIGGITLVFLLLLWKWRHSPS